jgi:hypothetical protein
MVMTIGMRAPAKTKGFLVSLAGVLLITACDDGHLRGYVEPAPDGKTYLVFEDDHGGCAIQVNGKAWPYARGEKGAVSPGIQVVKCGGELSFLIPEGVIFHFDYWGP